MSDTRYRKHTFASLATKDLKPGDYVGTFKRRVAIVYKIDVPETNKLAILWEDNNTLSVVDHGYRWFDVERVEKLPDEVDLATYYGYGSGPVTVSRKGMGRAESVSIIENRTNKKIAIRANVEELRKALDDLGF